MAEQEEQQDQNPSENPEQASLQGNEPDPVQGNEPEPVQGNESEPVQGNERAPVQGPQIISKYQRATPVAVETEEVRGRRKEITGKVIKNKMQKSIVVAVERKVKHPLYGKTVKKTSRFMAHDENDEASVGDIVHIMETRPLSKSKRWRLVNIVVKAK